MTLLVYFILIAHRSSRALQLQAAQRCNRVHGKGEKQEMAALLQHQHGQVTLHVQCPSFKNSERERETEAMLRTARVFTGSPLTVSRGDLIQSSHIRDLNLPTHSFRGVKVCLQHTTSQSWVCVQISHTQEIPGTVCPDYWEVQILTEATPTGRDHCP